jgi:prepilin-type N-terminal cleavage/methylation domain-containing protein/prepilin-type processing-associated H-X9-DG protein
MNSELNGAAFTAPASERTNHGGFTLLELLVVLATTGILVAMVLPTVGFSKAKPQAVNCMNNFNQLQKCCMMYTGDNRELYPPNCDAMVQNGYNWVSGEAYGWMPNLGAGGTSQAGDTIYLTNSSYDLLVPYIGSQIGIFKCPADPRICINSAGQTVRVVRSCSANQGVGTVDLNWLQTDTHSGPPTSPVSGPWLTGSHSEYPYSQYATFGKTTDFKNCSPSDIWIYVDDDPWSINDAAMAVVAEVPLFVDYPSTQHQNATGFSFADGHVEMHKWTSTVLIHWSDPGETPVLRNTPAYNDWYWWAWHATRSSFTGTVPRGRRML